jgi:hypothetical protein
MTILCFCRNGELGFEFEDDTDYCRRGQLPVSLGGLAVVVNIQGAPSPTQKSDECLLEPKGPTRNEVVVSLYSS